MIYTSTSLDKYNNCPRMYKYQYIDMIDKYQAPLFAVESIARRIGIAVHNIKAGQKISVDLDDIARAKVSAIVNLSYHAEIKLEYPKIEYLAHEVELGMSIDEHRIASKIDAIVEIDQDIWLLDYKTSKYKLTDAFMYDMKQQLMLYMMVARANGYYPKGVLIYYIRVPSLYIRKNDTHDSYLERCSEDILQNVDTYYTLIRITPKVIELERSKTDVLNTVAHITLDETAGYFRRNTDYCNEYRGKCVYKLLCQNMVDASDCQLRKSLYEYYDDFDNIQYPKCK